MAEFKWYDAAEGTLTWLVHGLITSNDFASFRRQTEVRKINRHSQPSCSHHKRHFILWRNINVSGDGRVLYLQVDRKDPKSGSPLS